MEDYDWQKLKKRWKGLVDDYNRNEKKLFSGLKITPEAQKKREILSFLSNTKVLPTDENNTGVHQENGDSRSTLNHDPEALQEELANASQEEQAALETDRQVQELATARKIQEAKKRKNPSVNQNISSSATNKPGRQKYKSVVDIASSFEDLLVELSEEEKAFPEVTLLVEQLGALDLPDDKIFEAFAKILKIAQKYAKKSAKNSS